MEHLTTENLIYLSVIIITAGLGIMMVIKHLSSLENLRRKRINKTQHPEVLTPENVNEEKIKKQSLVSIEKRFTITRRAMYCVIIGLLILAAAAPFVGKISPTLISVIVACVSMVVGIAAKPLIENLICGLVLCFGKLTRIGDVVLIDNEYGTIEDVTLTHCIIRRWDWLRYVVPNSIMLTKEFVNYSLRDNHRWVHVELWIDNRADLELVEKIALKSPVTSQYYSGSEEPKFWIIELTPEAAKCMVVAWSTSAADGWMLSIDIRKNLLLEFKKHNVETHLRRIAVNDYQQSKNKT
jgi:small-conductance mechanosensitive channel